MPSDCGRLKGDTDMSRRGENIYKRKDGRYEGRYVIGKTPSGRTRFGYVYARQYAEVRALLLQRKAERLQADRPSSAYRGTVADWMEHWMEDELLGSVKDVKPSARGELEITTLNAMYLEDRALDVQLLGRGFAWLDTGTMDSLVDAADFVRMVEKRQSIKISAPEEIAYKNGWITREKLLESADRYGKSPYGAHLRAVAEGKVRY